MKFGHHGGNHPVKDLDASCVMITAQNHGFAVDETSLPSNLRTTHVSYLMVLCKGSTVQIKQRSASRGIQKPAPARMMPRHCLIILSN